MADDPRRNRLAPGPRAGLAASRAPPVVPKRRLEAAYPDSDALAKEMRRVIRKLRTSDPAATVLLPP